MNKPGHSQVSLGSDWNERVLKSVGTSNLSSPFPKSRQILNSQAGLDWMPHRTRSYFVEGTSDKLTPLSFMYWKALI